MAGDLTYRGKTSPKADPILYPGSQLSPPGQPFNKAPPPRTGQFYHRPAYTDPQATQFGAGEQDDQAKPPPKRHSVLRSVLKFAAVQLGLAFLVIGYTVAGGFIFQELEQANEKDLCMRTREQYLQQVENVTLDQLWAISRAFRGETDPVKLAAGENQVLQVVETFGANSYSLGYTGDDCDTLGSADNPYMWNLAGAILFASTVVTTVGYGNMYPKTNWGRIVCIAYAILGIPLMLLWLANLGGVMADVFRFIYANVCCCRACRKKKPTPGSNKTSPSSSVGHSRTDLVGHAAGMGQSEAPQAAAGTDSSIEAWKAGFTAQQQLPQHGNNARVIEDEDPAMGDEEDEEDEEERVTVPLTITLSILGAYVFMGALLFGVWEGWSALTSAYFCFITIATIGFGDVVPGAAGKATAAAQMEMFGCAIYMVVGMAIVSMCFNLIQEEIVGKFQWIAEKFGIADKNKEGEEQQEAIEGKKKLEEDVNHARNPVPHQHEPAYHPHAANPNAAAPRSHKFNDDQSPDRPGSSESNNSKNGLIRY